MNTYQFFSVSIYLGLGITAHYGHFCYQILLKEHKVEMLKYSEISVSLNFNLLNK